MKVVFFLRKRYRGVYSIELLFEQLISAMPQNIEAVEKQMRFPSNGFFKRLYVSLESMFFQGDINHITGDIHFIALFLKKKSTVLTIHDIGFINHQQLLARFMLKWFWLILPIKKCAAITVVSEATKLEVLKFFNYKISSKIHVIHNPIRPIFFPKYKVFNAEEPVILQIGTKDNKNIPRLVEALSQIKCKLDIVGHLSQETLEKLKFYKIDYTVSANLSDMEIVKKYEQADIISFVSTYEGFGLPIIEANAIGRVVVTSNTSSMPEIAGNSAHLVNPFDSASIRSGFMKVINDTLYREKLILNGFGNVKRFEPTEIVAQYVNLYNSLIK
ncbi:MAG: glycosyltransferase family 4 protein [Cyclobacteriaceae bacterium]